MRLDADQAARVASGQQRPHRAERDVYGKNERPAMKGPRSRHKFNVLRIWECPLCQKRAFEPARVAHRACSCQGKDRPTWMRLIELPPPYRQKPAEAVPPAEVQSIEPI